MASIPNQQYHHHDSRAQALAVDYPPSYYDAAPIPPRQHAHAHLQQEYVLVPAHVAAQYARQPQPYHASPPPPSSSSYQHHSGRMTAMQQSSSNHHHDEKMMMVTASPRPAMAYHHSDRMTTVASPSTRSEMSFNPRPVDNMPTTSYSSRHVSPERRNEGAPLPIVIPQTTAKLLRTFMSPFMRAYPPQLAAAGMSQVRFLTFLDGLNEAFMASPVFQVVSMAGMITGFAPSVIAHGVGAGLQLASGLASAANSYARTRAYVTKANAEIFAPCGLRVRIVSTRDMMNAIGASESRLQLAPLPEFDQAWDPNSPATDPRVRRMEALQGRVAPLSTNIPPMQMPDSMLKKMGAWQARKQDEKERKEHAKQCRKDGKKKHNKNGASASTKFAEKEEKVNQRIRWIVITPVEKGAAPETEADVDLGLDEAKSYPRRQ